MTKHRDKLAGFDIRAAIRHALTLNEEADNADMIILRCGNRAWLCVIQIERYIDLLHNRSIGWLSERPKKYPDATGAIYLDGKHILVVPDGSRGKHYTLHDEDHQWSVTTTVE